MHMAEVAPNKVKGRCQIEILSLLLKTASQVTWARLAGAMMTRLWRIR